MKCNIVDSNPFFFNMFDKFKVICEVWLFVSHCHLTHCSVCWSCLAYESIFCRWLCLSVCLSICPSVCLSVCHKHCFFFFVSRWNRAISWPLVLHDKNYKTTKRCSSIFDLAPNAQNWLPKICTIAYKSMGHWLSHGPYQWVIESVIVCGSTVGQRNFG